MAPSAKVPGTLLYVEDDADALTAWVADGGQRFDLSDELGDGHALRLDLGLGRRLLERAEREQLASTRARGCLEVGEQGEPELLLDVVG